MTALLLALSHIGAFVLGATMWHAIAVREGRVLQGKEPAMPKHPKPGLSSRTWLLILVVVAGVMLAAFGVQQAAFQNQNAARTVCIQTWGVQLVDAVDARSSANIDVNRAERRRDSAIDNLLLFVNENSRKRAADEEPSQATRDRYIRLLGQFAVAKKHLDEARAEATQAQQENPYPPLECE